MVSIEQLSVEFGVKPLFTDVNFVINRHDRIALVGKNGAGKSTMLKIIAGLQSPSRGRVSKPKELTIGYLPQVMILSDTMTVRQETEKAFASTIALEQRLAEMNSILQSRTDYESQSYADLIEAMTELNEQLTVIQSQNRDAEIERTLIGLGFERTDFDRPTCEFSGGWRMRIELAKILLQRPNLLLLDEPTNHLDTSRLLAEPFTTIMSTTLSTLFSTRNASSSSVAPTSTSRRNCRKHVTSSNVSGTKLPRPFRSSRVSSGSKSRCPSKSTKSTTPVST